MLAGFQSPENKDLSARRKADYKKALSQDDNRRKRGDNAIQIRKNKRQESLAKRRARCTSGAGGGGGALAALLGKSGAAGAGAGSNNGASSASQGAVGLSLHDLPKYVAGCMASDAATQLEATRQVRRLLSREQDPPVQQIIDSGVLPRLVSFLECASNPQLQFEATWALTNVASTQYTSVVVDLGIVPTLANLCKSPSADVREQSVWCLGNIAGDGCKYRDMILGVPNAVNNILLNVAHPENISMLRNATWALSNFCRGKPQPHLSLVAPIVPALNHLIKQQDKDVLTDACWALSYVSDGDNARIQAVIDAGCVARISELLEHPDHTIVTPALRVMGNIVSGDDSQTNQAVTSGALPRLTRLMNHQRRTIRKEACWALSNVAAGTPEQVLALIQTPEAVMALHKCLKQAEWSVKKEAAWAISNLITSAIPSHIEGFVQCGAIQGLADLLTVADAKITGVALDAIGGILASGEAQGHTKFVELVEECGALDKIESLQDHENEDIYKKVVHIMQTYFEVDAIAEEDEEAAPAVDAAAGTFAFGASTTTQAGFGGFSFDAPAMG